MQCLFHGARRAHQRSCALANGWLKLAGISLCDIALYRRVRGRWHLGLQHISYDSDSKQIRGKARFLNRDFASRHYCAKTAQFSDRLAGRRNRVSTSSSQTYWSVFVGNPVYVAASTGRFGAKNRYQGLSLSLRQRAALSQVAIR